MDRAVDYDLSVTNEELLELCKRQDQEALRVLFKRYERPVYSLLFRMLSNHEDSEEALAEVFVKVWRSAGGFKGDSKFTTWLFRIAANTARDYLRSRQARPEVYLEDTVTEVGARGQSCLGAPEATAILSDEKDRIVRAMKELSEEDRLLITLYHFQECEYDEISRITGVKPGNLKVKLFRARQRLKKLCDRREGNQDEMRADTTGASGLCEGAADWT